MNYWTELPDRDEVLKRIFHFLKLLSLEFPDEAAKWVNLSSMDKFRDTLHYFLADHAIMILDDEELFSMPDDLSIAITNPEELDEEEIEPTFSGNDLILQPHEKIELKIGFNKTVTPIVLRFVLYPRNGRYYLDLVKVFKQ